MDYEYVRKGWSLRIDFKDIWENTSTFSNIPT